MMEKYILIPKDIDIDWFATIGKPLPEGIHPDRILCFIYIIHYTYLFDSGARTKNRIMGDNFVYLHSLKLKQIHSRYKEVLVWLQDMAIIDIDNSYWNEHHPRSYQLSGSYLFSDVKLFKITDKATISKVFPMLHRVDSPTSSKYKALFSDFKRGKLEFDDSALETALNASYEEDLASSNHEIAIIKKVKRRYSAELLKNNQLWFFQDNKGQRLHTNLTNMSKAVREQLKFNNQTLIEVDIKNSQPYFLLKLLSETYAVNLNNIIMFLESDETTVNRGFQRFVELVKEGRIYDFFKVAGSQKYGATFVDEYVRQMLFWKTNNKKAPLSSYVRRYGYRKKYLKSSQWSPPDLRGKSDREVVKNMFFQVLYGKHNSKSSHIKLLFQELFAEVWYCLGKLKETDHSNLAIQLQKIESNAVLDVVCRRVKREKRSVPLFTIHDCLVTTANHIEFVEQVLKEELLNITGFEPKLTTKDWRR